MLSSLAIPLFPLALSRCYQLVSLAHRLCSFRFCSCAAAISGRCRPRCCQQPGRVARVPAAKRGGARRCAVVLARAGRRRQRRRQRGACHFAVALVPPQPIHFAAARAALEPDRQCGKCACVTAVCRSRCFLLHDHHGFSCTAQMHVLLVEPDAALAEEVSKWLTDSMFVGEFTRMCRRLTNSESGFIALWSQ